MAEYDSETHPVTSSVVEPPRERDLAETQARASAQLKLFAILAVFVAIGLVGLVEVGLREQRNLAFEMLERDGLSFVTGFALSNPGAMVDGDGSGFEAAAAELMRRPDLQFIRLDSPRSAEPLTLMREGFTPRRPTESAQRAVVPSSRLDSRDDVLLLEVVVPLQSVISEIHTKVDSNGKNVVPVAGSLTMAFDASETQVALATAANRMRAVLGVIAVLILAGAWISIRRALEPFDRLGDAAQRIAAGQGGVELLRPATKEAHRLTLGLAAIQQQLRRSAAGRRHDRMQSSPRFGSTGDDLNGDRPGERAGGVARAARERSTPSDRDRASRGSHHVLLVEDNPVNRSVAVGMLKALDCTVVCAEDGVASLAAFEAESFDLVFMDIQMPRMDGHEATRRIRAEEERIGADPTPIIALTAHSQVEARAASVEAGMNGHISKPFTRDDLRLAIREWGGSRKRGKHLDG